MIEIFDCEQNSEEWLRVRMGIPTSSQFHAILAKGEGKTRRSYLLRLAGEVLTGEPAESFSNGSMQRGKRLEPEARSMYEFLTDAQPHQVGFVRNGRMGCSPDSFIGDDGSLEIKTKAAHLQIEALEAAKVPNCHMAQVQGILLVTGRDWCDFMSYWPKMKPLIKRVYRDEPYIANLRFEIERFNEELDAIVEKAR